MIVKIALPIEQKDGTMGYYYKVPPNIVDKISLGQRVIVPFGGNELVGYIFLIEKDKDFSYPLKSIISLIDKTSYLSESFSKFALQIAKYYFTNPYHVFELMFPKYKKLKKEILYQIINSSDLPESFRRSNKAIYRKDELHISEIKLKHYLEIGAIEKKFNFLPLGKQKEEIVYSLGRKLERKKNEKQVAILSLFEDNLFFTKKEIEDKLGYSITSSLNTLVKNGYLIKEKRVLRRRPSLSDIFLKKEKIKLNKEQLYAYNCILHGLNTYHSYLLHGITGSGKTEIYIKLIKEILEQHKTALILVPEISLTPQLFARFYSVFGERVGLWHSALSDGEKFDEWTSLVNGETKVLIGVRSAIFAPIKNLGIIIIDEAHDSSYKQSEPEPRYHAIEVAELLAQKENIPLVFGSATPSIAMRWQAEKGKHTYLTLKTRAKSVYPIETMIVDMKASTFYRDGYFFSVKLIEKISERLKRNEQCILYLNRRGFSTYVYCRECGEALTCPHCQSYLTYHKTTHALKCHYCDETFPMIVECPHCKSKSIQYKGYGTEQVQAYLTELFQDAKICRLDYETTREKNSYQKILTNFQKGDYDILIGTQMIAKGLDNDNVTLVGVINSDVGFNLLDYKAKERLFQQLVQVSGRSGRGNKRGEVILQTYQPDSEIFTYVKNEDYDGFYLNELKERALYEYPPYVDILRLVISDTNEVYLKKVLKVIKDDIIKLSDNVTVYGPAPCPMFTIRGRYRYQFIFKGQSKELFRLGWLLRHKYRYSKKSKSYRFMLDLSPETIL